MLKSIYILSANQPANRLDIGYSQAHSTVEHGLLTNISRGQMKKVCWPVLLIKVYVGPPLPSSLWPVPSTAVLDV